MPMLLQLARKYLEFEKMDQGIKKALPQSGTKGFPRAPLPSTNFQTSDNLCRSLENYLEALLREPRYAACDPVARFFEKERTDSKAGVVNPLVFLGQGVNNIGKGVTGVGKGIGRSGEMATRSIATGFNQFTNTITALPGLKRTSSGHMESGGPPTPTKTNNVPASSSPMHRRSSADSLSAQGASGSKQNLTSPSTTSLATSISSVKEEDEQEPTALPSPSTVEPALVDTAATAEESSASDNPPPPVPKADPPALLPRPASPGGYDVPESSLRTVASPVDSTPKDLPEVTTSRPSTAMQTETPPGFSYTPRKKANVPTASEQAEAVIKHPEMTEEDAYPAAPVDAGGRMSFDELLEKDRELQKKMAEKEAVREQLNNDLLPDPLSSGMEKTSSGQSQKAAGTAPAHRITQQSTTSNLSAMEFSSVLSFAMAILEEAYELSDSTWNLRRGILRMLETVLRTSYAGVIRAGMTKLVQSVSEEDFYVSQIDKLRQSFWPPPEDV